MPRPKPIDYTGNEGITSKKPPQQQELIYFISLFIVRSSVLQRC